MSMANNGDQSPYEDNDKRTMCCKSRSCHYNNHNLKKWVEETSVYGVPHVFKGKSKIRRLAWALILVCLIIGCLYTIADNLNRYIKKPTATTVAIEKAELTGLAFPAVTVCSLNAYESSEIAQFTEFLFNPDLAYDSRVLNKLGMCDKALNNITEDVRNAAIWEVIQKSSRNFVYFCGFNQGVNSTLYRCEKELEPTLTSLGICYTINSITKGRSDLYITSTGAKYGLKMIFNISQINHPPIEGNTGIKIVVHERDDIPRPNLYGFGIPPGRNAYIGLRKKIDIDHTSNVGCIDDRKLSFYPHYDYSQFACRQNARVEHIAQPNTCNCILDSSSRPFSGPYANTPNCTFNDTCCLLNQYSSFDARVGCPVPCQFEYYDNTISYSSFPTGPYLEDIAITLNMSKDSIRDDVVSVSIFFEDLQVTSTTTEYSYPFSAFLADLGGALGLFLGASLIAFIEIGMLLLDELKRLLLPRKCKKKVETFDATLNLPEITDKSEQNKPDSEEQLVKETEA